MPPGRSQQARAYRGGHCPKRIGCQVTSGAVEQEVALLMWSAVQMLHQCVRRLVAARITMQDGGDMRGDVCLALPLFEPGAQRGLEEAKKEQSANDENREARELQLRIAKLPRSALRERA